MVYFKKSFKYNIKIKVIYYKENFNSPNILIQKIIKLYNKFYKLAIKI